ncbi:MAG: response regulator, partial [Candidatus Paceibacterota bacterium]
QAADSLVRLLRKIGGDAEAVYSGEEALAHDISNTDIVLLDVGMPRVDGYQVMQTLRSRSVRIPVVALTGYGLLEDKQRALDAGFTAHLTKPVGLKELLQIFDTIQK